MKKMLTALSVFLTGLALAQVESQVVGYNTVEIPAGQQYTMLGFNFNEVGATEGIDIQDLIPNPTANGLNAGDTILVWNGNGYDTYTLNSATSGPVALRGKWTKSGVLASYKLNPGTGLWLNRANVASDVTITLKGEVVATDAEVRSIVAGFNMITSEYPDGISLNGTEGNPGYVNWIASGATAGDTIMVWNGSSGYDSYTLASATSGPVALRGKWVKSGAAANYTIPMGSAVWYNAINPFTFEEGSTL